MTTIFRVRIEAVEGSQVTMDVDHVYGWDWARHLVNSRTLALHFLWEPLLGYIRYHIPFPDGRRISWEEADALVLTFPLGKELAGRNSTDEPWNRANVGRFISCVGVVNRRHNNEMWNGTSDLRWDYPRHVEREEIETAKATYLIAVTDPRWLAHLAPGMEWDSTAYDHDDKVVVDPEWRTSTVLAIAKQVDESGDFSALPILADALQDAGCTDLRILDHCRGLGPHARGCWAVDLLLGGGFDPRVLDVTEVSQVDLEFWPVVTRDTVESPPPAPGGSSTSPEDIAALLAPIRSAQELEAREDWALGTIRFTRRRGEALELLFYPGRDPKHYELRAAGREYTVPRKVFVAAVRKLGIKLPLKQPRP